MMTKTIADVTAASAWREVRDVYQGDGPQNGYERFGRATCAALLVALWIAIGAMLIVAPIAAAGSWVWSLLK